MEVPQYQPTFTGERRSIRRMVKASRKLLQQEEMI
jgi:hypothetical protein